MVAVFVKVSSDSACELKGGKLLVSLSCFHALKSDRILEAIPPADAKFVLHVLEDFALCVLQIGYFTFKLEQPVRPLNETFSDGDSMSGQDTNSLVAISQGMCLLDRTIDMRPKGLDLISRFFAVLGLARELQRGNAREASSPSNLSRQWTCSAETRLFYC